MPKMVVLALKCEIDAKSVSTIHRRPRPRPLSCGGGASTTAALVCRISGDFNTCHFDILESKLRGCVVISKGIVVVEGENQDIRRYLKFMTRKDSDSLKVIWEGKVTKPSFGKFSILHSSSDVPIFKFFVDHGATLYWDIAYNMNES